MASKKNIEDVHTLSPIQEGMLFHSLLEPDSHVYMNQLALPLHEAIDLDRFKQAWQQLFDRHAMLRSVFTWEKSKKPLLVVGKKIIPRWREEDWRHLGMVLAREKVRAFIRADRCADFDLSKAPIMRLALLRVSDDETFFVWNSHHILQDGWSSGLLLGELQKIYHGLTVQVMPRLAEPGRYRDFVTFLGKQDLNRAEVFWRGYLAGFQEPTPLPMDRLTLDGKEDYSTERRLRLPEETMTRVKTLARSANVTVNTVVQAVWSVVLCRYAAREDVVFGATVSGRPPGLRGVEMIFGPMLNTVPVRVEVAPELDILSWLGKVQASAVQGLEFQNSPAQKVNEWSELSPGVNVYDSIIVFENFPFDGLEGIIKSHFALEEIEGYEQTNFPLTLTVVPLDNLTFKLRYLRAHFSDKRALRLLEAVGDLLESILGADRVADLFRSTTEEARLLAAWNETDRDYDRAATLYGLFERSAARKPTAVALVADGREFSYGELDALAGKTAYLLRDHGIGRGSLVGILVDRSALLPVYLLGVLRAGAAYVPLDPTHPTERLGFIVEDSGLALTLVDSADSPADLAAPCLALSMSTIAITPATLAYAAVDPANLAYVIYTSGSTGRPKGVEVNQGTVVNFLSSMVVAPGLGEQDRLLAVTTISFDISGLEIFLPLMVGAVVVLASRETTQDGFQLARMLEDERITVAQATPATWQLLFASQWEGKRDLRVFCGGEALPDDLARRLRASCHSLWNLYGPTETTIWSTATTVEDLVHIGRPIANTQIHLLRSRLSPAPLGAAGEVFIGGLGLARGYHHRPALSAERFLPDPFSKLPGARLYRSGDLARFDEDGAIHYLSRVDFQIKIRGFRIEQGEIERVLVEHADISAAVVALADTGSGSPALVAYFTRVDNVTPGALELREFLGFRLPDYMIPAIFVCLDSLPLTQNGKIDRNALPDVSRVRGAGSAPPRDENEREMASIWTEILGCSDLSIHDNFFELGGHSLLAMRLIGAIRAKFGVRLPLYKLLKVPTVAGSAALAASLTGGEEKTADAQEQVVSDPANRCQPFPLTDVQYAYLIGRGEAFELSSSGTQGYMELDVERLDPIRLETAWNALIRRHDMLRAVYYPDLQQVQAEVPEYRIASVDLRGLSEADVTGRIDRWREEMMDTIFDPESWPLFDIRCSRLDDRYKIHFSADMLIADATSFQILYREWTELYDQPEKELPTLDLTFRDVVLSMAKVQQTKRYQESLDYWKKRLPSLPPAPALPLACNPEDVKEGSFVRCEFALPKPCWQRLKQRARELHVTPSALVLSAFGEVLANWSSSSELSINLTVFHRPPVHDQINEVVGDFTTTTYVAVNEDSGESYRERVVGIQGQLWESMAHAHVSGVEVLRMLSKLRTSHTVALMPVVFTSMLAQTSEDRDATTTPLGAEIVYSQNATSQVWLDHQAYEQDGTLYCRWDTVDELFHNDMLEAMFGAYERHLTALADSDWDLVTPSLTPLDQLAFRAEINRTEMALDEGLLHEAFLAQAREHPQRTAVITSSRNLSYGELYRISLDLAYSLRELGVRPGATVGVVMEKGWEQVAALMGIEMAGGAYVPIAPELPDERRHLLLEDCAASQVLTQSTLGQGFSWPASCQAIYVDTVQPRDLAPLELFQGFRDIAYIIFTSGSTGTPKGVVIDHRGARNTVLDINRRFSVGPEDRILGISRLGFDLSVYDVFGPLTVGAALVLPDHYTVPDPVHWAAMMREHRVTIWNSAPPLMQILTTSCQGDSQENPDPRLILLSGDWIPLNLPAEMRAQFPAAQFISMGGATEASIWSIIYPFDQVEPGWNSVPYGKPMVNQTFHVFDGRLQPCPTWVTGHLYIGGIGLALGYLGDEEKTRASFFYHGASGERLYRTGDMGRYLPDGNIEFLGRDDSQVKIQGHRIELGEIESTLLQHEQVSQAMVAAVGEDKKNRRLVAYYVVAEGEKRNDPELAGAMDGVITDNLQRLAFKLEQPGIRKDLDVSGALPLNKNERDRTAYIRRQSYREYLGMPVSRASIGALLEHLGAITEPGAPFPKYRYPSAGNLYAVQTYLYFKETRVDGAEQGFYYYHPVEHSLCYLSGGDLEPQRFSSVNANTFEKGAFAIFLVADLDVLEPIYGKGAQDFCVLEAGYMGQLLMEQAPQHMLGLCPIGRFEVEGVRSRMSLGDRHILLHTLVGGSVSAKQQAMLAMPEGHEEDGAVSEETLRVFLGGKLPAYMVPGILIALEKMPLSATGKIDRKRLPKPDLSGDEHSFAAPSSTLEKRITEVWQDVLGLSSISVTDSFFELGGHSVTATRVVARLNQELCIELGLRELFLEPTVRDLTTHIRKNHDMGLGKVVQTSALPKLLVDPSAQYEAYELTDVQQAYWIGRRDDYQLGGVATHSYSEMDCPGLDLPRFQAAWQKLVVRHPMLRTVINADGRQQLLADVPDYEIAFDDFLSMDELQAEVRQQEIRDSLSHQVFDTSKWPIFEIRAARISQDCIRLFCSLDLITADSWSFRIMSAELWHFYTKPEPELPVLELTFRDYLLAEQKLRQTDLYGRSLAYWKSRLAELPPAPSLPMVKKPQDLQAMHFVRRMETIDKEAWHRIKKIGGKRGLTPSIILLTAFSEVLGTWSESQDFTINLTLFNRLPIHSQVNDIVGDFTSLTLLSIFRSAGDGFGLKAQRHQQQLLADLEHRYVSGVEVLRMLSQADPNHAMAQMPVVFTSTLTQDWDAGAAEEERFGEVTYSVSQTARVWLDHQVMEDNGQLLISWDSVDALFPAGMLDEMFAAYANRLKQLARDEQVWDRVCPSLLPSSSLQARLLANDTAAPVTEGLIHSAFVENVLRKPNEIAVIAPDMMLSYDQLLRHALPLARQLRDAGALPDQLVGLVFEKGWQQVVGSLAILLAGGAYLPIDATLPVERLHQLLALGGCRLAVTGADLRDRLNWPETVSVWTVSDQPTDEQPLELLESVQQPNDLAYVIFTSGSTGQPKGVAIEHRGALNTLLDVNARHEVAPGDRLLGVSSMSFDLSVYDVFGILGAGATLVLPEPARVPDPTHWARLMKEHRVTIWNSVPALMQILVDYLRGQPDHGIPLRLVLKSGDWIPIALPDQIRELWPDARSISMGGATEGSIWSIIYEIGKVDPAWPSIPYGKPMVNQTYHVRNTAGQPCPDWVTGHLYIGGIGVAREYWGDADKTASSFIDHAETGERLYATGDLGRYLPDGNIEFLGRDDFQVKVQGYRIELGEIESVLRDHAAVSACLVDTVGDRHDRRLVAYIVAAVQDPDYDEIKSLLAERLPAYMVPSQHVFIDAFPLTANGKVNRKALPTPGADHKARGQAKADGAPAVLIEETAALIGGLLEIDPPDSHEDLYNIGVNSVDIIRIMNLAEKRFGVRPQLIAFLENPTVFGLASLVNELVGVEQGEATLAGPIPRPEVAVLTDPAEREAFKTGEPARRNFEDVCNYDLGQVDEAQLLLRRSWRGFLGKPITRESFQDLMTGLASVEINGLRKHGYPSAGSTYAVQTYVYIKKDRIEGFPGGIYYFDPAGNRLQLFNSQPGLSKASFEPFINAPIFERAAFCIILVAKMGAIEPLYGGQAASHVYIEAGAIIQLLMARAIETNLGMCPIGEIADQTLREDCFLDEDHLFLNLLMGGAVDPSLPWTSYKDPASMAVEAAEPLLVRTDLSQPIPLSPPQERLWVLQQLDPENSAYNETSALHLRGRMDVVAWWDGVTHLIERHPMLRTRFTTLESRPHQIIEDATRSELTLVDLRHLPEDRCAESAHQLVLALSLVPFDLTASGLFRPLMIRLSDEVHYFVLVLHHIVADFWSSSILHSEFMTLYNAQLSGTAAELPELPIQYADYARWQRKRLTRERLEELLAFWRETLRDVPVLELPVDRVRQRVQSFEGERVFFSFPTTLVHAIQAFSVSHSISVFNTILAAYQTLLFRYSEQTDISVGVPIANRDRSELETIIGFFVNSLVMRTDLSGRPGFAEVAKRVRDMSMRAYAHQDAPFERVVDACAPDRSMTFTPLFQAVLDFLAIEEGDAEPLGLSIEPLEFHNGTCKFDVVLSVAYVRDKSLSGFIEYNSEIFERERIERMTRHLPTLLADALDHPEREIDRLQMLPEAELAELAAFNDSRAPYTTDRCLHQLFETAVAARPDAPAARCGEDRLSYAELNQHANRLAHLLISQGVKSGSYVGICLNRSLDMLVGVLGINKAGGIYVPMDADFPAERIHGILADVSAAICVTHSGLSELFEGSVSEPVFLDTGDFSQFFDANPDLEISPDDFSYVIFTSGSTGRPKGVILQHRPVVNLIEWVNQTYAVGADDRILFITSLCFDLSVYDIFGMLAAGGQVEVAVETQAKNPEALVELIETRGITFWDSAPAALDQLVSFLPEQGKGSTALRLVFLSGDWIPLTLPPAMQRCYPNLKVIGLGGATEAAIWSNFFPVGEILPHWKSVPYGRPIQNARYYVLNAALQRCPKGVPGDLYIGDKCLSFGYFGQPALTAQRYLPDPYNSEPGSVLYRTGDRNRHMPDTVLEFLGRLDGQVKVRGYRIELGEIEARLAGHPLITQSAVIAREISFANKRLAAFVVTEQELSTGDLRAFLGETLPDYMIPATFSFLEALPVTSNGKLDRKALHAHTPAQAEAQDGFTAPATKIEIMLADIWKSLLGLERVDVHDHFFEVGGDSILAIQVVNKARAEGYEANPRQLFEFPTIARLAQVLPTLAVLEESAEETFGELPLTPVQHWFFETVTTDPHCFNQSTILEVHGCLDVEAMDGALKALGHHHGVLRSRFTFAQFWRQEIPAPEDWTALTLEVVELEEIDPAERAAMREHATEHIHGSLDLAGAQLMRAVYFDYGADEPGRLLLVAHHLLVDGISWRILIEDLSNAYQMCSSGESVILPRPTTSYGVWSRRLSEYVTSGKLAREKAFWRTLAQRRVEPLPKTGEGDNSVASTRIAVIELDESGTETLVRDTLQTCRAEINDVLLAVLALTLRQWLNREEFLVNLEGHGREELFAKTNLSNTVGWFTSMYPVYLDLAGITDRFAAMGMVKDQLHTIPSKGIGYGILRYLHPDEELRDLLAAAPRPEIGFNYFGRFDTPPGGDGLFRPANEESGLRQSPRQERLYALDFNCVITQSRFQLSCSYSSQQYAPALIEGLLDNFKATLEDLNTRAKAGQVMALTPSDFPEAALTRGELAVLVDRLESITSNSAAELEMIYPLSPLQLGMFYHVSQAPGTGLYVLQLCLEMRGEFDVAAFKKAWQTVIANHDIFRALYVGLDTGKPLQVVLSKIALPFAEQDWRQDEEDLETRFEAFLLADRNTDFVFDRAPLMRLHLIRVADDCQRFVWTLHHVLSDGWSNPVVLMSLFQCYKAYREGRQPSLHKPRPYRDFIRWIGEQDPDLGKAFWQKYLQGFKGPNKLIRQVHEDEAERAELRKEITFSLDVNKTDEVKRLVRHHKVTLSVAVQGLWGLALGFVIGDQDVVFGTTISGRPSELPGVEHIVGPFIATLPVRVRFQPDQSLADWVSELQAAQIERGPHEHTPLVDIQQSCKLPAGESLFQCLLQYQNYPKTATDEEGDDPLSVSFLSVKEKDSYPFTLMVIPGDTLAVMLKYDPARLEPLEAERLVQNFRAAIEAFLVSDENTSLQTIHDQLAAADRQVKEQEQKAFQQAQSASFLKKKRARGKRKKSLSS